MKKFTILFNIAIIVTLFILVYFQFFSEDKLGYVDTFKLLNEYKGVQKTKVLLEREANKWKGKQDTLQMEFDAAVKVYEQESKTYSKTESQMKLKHLQEKKAELERFKSAIQQEMVEKEKNLTEEALVPVDEFIKKYGKKHRYKFIFAATGNGNIIYANEAVDLTDEILKELNK